MTPAQLELIQEAENLRWEREKRVEIFTINSIIKMLGGKKAKDIKSHEFLGIKYKEYLDRGNFATRKEWIDYLKEEGLEID